MILASFLVLTVVPFALGAGYHDHDKPDKYHACTLCNECFVDYHDCDIWIPKKPYKMAADGFNTGINQCLAACMKDEECGAVVYGMIGGRKIYTCELYKEINPTTAPRYTPFINTYVKRQAMPCMIDYSNEPEVELMDADDEPEKRKHRYSRLFSKPNPFYWGRR